MYINILIIQKRKKNLLLTIFIILHIEIIVLVYIIPIEIKHQIFWKSNFILQKEDIIYH